MSTDKEKPNLDSGSPTSHMSRFTYVPCFFKHDQQPTGPEHGFRAETLPGLGIIDRTYSTDEDSSNNLTQWQRFERHIHQLNKISEDGERYKVFLIARHGEGVHNVKEREVGRHEWERHWARLDGDGQTTWLDARLTPKGIQQAEALGRFWKDTHETAKMPLPENFYTSPLTRALETVRWTFSRDLFPNHESFRPIVKEAIREVFGVHACDKRSTRSWIKSEFPESIIEPGFTEADELWTPQKRETLDEHAAMVYGFLEEVFRDDSATFVSVTTHSGTIRAFYLAVGHPDVWVAAGAVVPVVVRGKS